MQDFLAESVEDVAEACVGVLIDHNVRQIIANGNTGGSSISHILYSAERMWVVLQKVAQLSMTQVLLFITSPSKHVR